MIVLKILGIVLGILLAIVLLVLLLVCLVKITVIAEADSLHYLLTLKVLFLKLRFPREKKAEKPKEEQPKRTKKKSSSNRWPMSDPLELVRMIWRLLKRFPRMLRHIRIHWLLLHIRCGGDDPAAQAMTYGSICAAVYPLLGYIESTAKPDPDAMDVEVLCDFDLEKTETEIQWNISLRGVYVIWALLGVLLH